MKKNGFTLIELLAVIVILAIILVIAVPKIMDTINSARKSAIESTGKLIVSSAEKAWLIESVSPSSPSVFTNKAASCSAVTDMNSDYATGCTVTIGTDGKVSAITGLAGATGGKFDGYTCSYANSVVTCSHN